MSKWEELTRCKCDEVLRTDEGRFKVMTYSIWTENEGRAKCVCVCVVHRVKRFVQIKLIFFSFKSRKVGELYFPVDVLFH